MRLLLVEDEPDVASVIKRTLEEERYEVAVAMDGLTAWEYMVGFQYDLFVLDVMLPGIGGMELCRRCRKEGMATPILMLTALGTTDNVVMGLDSGADDYLTKPFNLTELKARIRSLLRRPFMAAAVSQQGNALRSFADVVINQDEKTVFRNHQPVELTATEFRLLEYFLRNPRKVLSRMDLLEQVWGYDYNLNTKVVDVYINYLRKKLEKDSLPRLIHTVVGMGYILKDSYHEHTN